MKRNRGKHKRIRKQIERWRTMGARPHVNPFGNRAYRRSSEGRALIKDVMRRIAEAPVEPE